MNPMIKDALLAAVRHLLALLGGYLVASGFIDEGQATLYASGGAVFLVGLIWSIWQKFTSRQKLVTALSMPKGTTEHDVEAVVRSGDAATVTTPKDVSPVPGGH